MFHYKSLLLLAGATCAIHCQGNNILMNGDFEEPITGTPGTGAFPFQPGPVDNYQGGRTLRGWVVGGDSIDVVPSNFWRAAHGKQSIDLNGLGPGYIYQDLNTVPGATYQLRFAMAGNGNALTKNITTMAVLWSGLVADILTFDTSSQTSGDLAWEYYEYTLIANQVITRLAFQSLSPKTKAGAASACCGAALDDVSLEGVGSAIWPPIEPLPTYTPFGAPYIPLPPPSVPDGTIPAGVLVGFLAFGISMFRQGVTAPRITRECF